MLNDLLKEKLDVVICGAAAGHNSAKVRQYYAGRGNRFWKTLKEIKLTTKILEPADYHLLLEFGIGLTDLVKKQAGNDNQIKFSKFDSADLEKKILKYQPRYLCFNGKAAAKKFLGIRRVEYGIQKDKKIGETVLFVAPSTSGSANRFWNEEIWKDLAKDIKKQLK